MMDVECWMVDSFRIQNCSFKISQPVRRVRFQEIIFLTKLTGLAGLGQEEIQAVHSCRRTWAGIPRPW